MRQGYGSQSNLSGWRFSVGSVPLNERRSREGNGEKVGALQGGTGRRDVRRKNGDGVGKGVRVSLPHPYLLIFLPLSYFAQHSTISTPGKGYDYKQTASYTGFPRTTLNKLKNSVLVLQITINTETYVITSTTILKLFYSVYIHLLKCPPQSHCQFHCPPLFSLQDGVTFISPVALTEPLTTAPVLRKLVFT